MKHRVAADARLTQGRNRPANLSSYSLGMEHPASGATAYETYASLPAVVDRAARVIAEGYNVVISSSATRFDEGSNRIDAYTDS